MHEVRDGGESEGDAASSNHKDGARITVHHGVAYTPVGTLDPYRCPGGTFTVTRVDGIAFRSHIIQPTTPISRLLYHKRQAIATRTGDGEGVDLGPAENADAGRKDAKADVLAWTPAGVEVRDLDPGHPQLGDWAKGCGADSGLEYSDKVVKSIYTHRSEHPWDGCWHVQGDPDWEEDNPEDVCEEKDIVKPSAPEAYGEQEKDVHGDKSNETESNIVGHDSFRDDSLQGPFIDWSMTH